MGGSFFPRSLGVEVDPLIMAAGAAETVKGAVCGVCTEAHGRLPG